MNLPLSPGGRRYGYLRRPSSHQAYGFASIPGIKLAAPPPKDYHLQQFMPPVKDQKDLGACTAFTGTEDREAIARQYESKSPILSPLFLYYKEREIDGSLDQGDCGSTGETSCRALNQFGICEESDDPYNTSNFERPPNQTQLTNALNWKAGAYHTIYSLEDLKLCVNSGYRFRMGMLVFDSFENDINSSGLMPIPNARKESVLGGHEILGYAYDDTIKCPGANSPGAALIRNSWSASWGKSGDFWISYELLTPDSIVRPDFKIQHLGPKWQPKP